MTGDGLSNGPLQDSPVHRGLSDRSHLHYNTEYLPATSTRTIVTAQMKPAGGIVIPPNPLPPGPNSASGCAASDFNGHDR